MKKFREYLKKHTRRITNFKKKNIKLLKIKQQESYENAKICYVCGETFEDNDKNDKKNVKLENRCHYTGEYRGAAHSICNLKLRIPKEITAIVYNESNYDYHSIIKKISEEFERQFTIILLKEFM